MDRIPVANLGLFMEKQISKLVKRAGTASELVEELEYLGDTGVRDRAESLSPSSKVVRPGNNRSAAVQGPSRDNCAERNRAES